MTTAVPPAIEAEIASIAESPEGEKLRKLLAQARLSGSDEVLAAQLAGIYMEPVAYRRFDSRLGQLFTNQSNLNYPQAEVPVVIIGSGYHAAVFAAVRHNLGFDKPYVLESDTDPGGVFAVTQQPSFILNSEVTGGPPGSPWDDGPNDLNWLPGAPVQACQLTARELPDNTVMRYIIRVTLALHARVITRATVSSCRLLAGKWTIQLASGRVIRARRVIDARGMGPEKASGVDGKRVLTWSQAMTQMDTDFPFTGMNRVAVIGGGKSGLCAAESLLGVGPDGSMRTAAGGMPSRVDLFSVGLPQTRQAWLANVQTRYSRLASHLPVGLEDGEDEDDNRPYEPAGYGKYHDLYVRNEIGSLSSSQGGVLVNGRFYDHAIMCTGHNPPQELIRGAGVNFAPHTAGGRNVAVKAVAPDGPCEYYKTGPCADLAWAQPDYAAKITANLDNRVAMFRLGPLTAVLAATLPEL